jgi:hypothetical protein
MRKRSEKGAIVAKVEKVDLYFGELMFVPFLGFFASGDQFAHGAGMIAIERFDNGDGNGIGPGEADEHTDPGAGLEDDPVSTDGKDQQTCNDDVLEPWFQPSSIA